MPDRYVNHCNTTLQPDGRYTHTFTQSFLSSVQKCPESARAVYMREVESELTDSQALGVAVHAGIEYALTEKILTEEAAPMDDALDVAGHELDSMWPWVETKFKPEQIQDRLWLCLNGWYGDIEPTIHPLGVEERFKYLFYTDDHRDIYLSGTMDCLTEDLGIWDWKTAGRPHEPWQQQRWGIQATAYCWAAWQLSAGTDPTERYWTDLEEPLTFSYAVMLHDGTTQQYEVWRDQSHVDWLRQQALVCATMLETNPHGPWTLNDSSWYCHERWCPVFAKGECKGAYMKEGWTTR